MNRTWVDLWNGAGNGQLRSYAVALARANVEMWGLLSRRGRAYVDLSSQLAQCRTPQQVCNEHAMYITDMMHDWQVTNDRLMSIWASAVGPVLRR